MRQQLNDPLVLPIELPGLIVSHYLGLHLWGIVLLMRSPKTPASASHLNLGAAKLQSRLGKFLQDHIGGIRQGLRQHYECLVFGFMVGPP